DVDHRVEADVLAALVGRLTPFDERLDVGPARVRLAHHAEGRVVGVEVGPLVESTVVAEVAVLRDRAPDRVLVAHEEGAYSVPPDMTHPSGSYRRRIRVTASPDQAAVTAELEDDFHHFRVTVAHDGACVTGVRATGVRFPWSTC